MSGVLRKFANGITLIPVASDGLNPDEGSLEVLSGTSALRGYLNGAWRNILSSLNGFEQNGNSFGAAANLGTNDTFGLNLRTNGLARLTISSAGAFDFNSGVITNAGTINGVTITAHAGRHLPLGADPLTTAAAVTINAASTNTEGTANSFARSDHTHAITTGAPITQAPDQANATGTSASLARADHVHNIPADVPVSVGSANAEGTSSSFARADHVHQGVHSLAVDSGTARFGDINLVSGAGISIADNGSGSFSINSTANVTASYKIDEEFISENTSTSLTSGTSSYGMGWLFRKNGGAVTAADNTNVTALHPGILSLSTDGDSHGSPVLNMSTDGIIVGNGTLKYQWLILTPATLPSASQDYIMRFGLGDQTGKNTTDFTNGVYFEFPANGTATILYKTANASTRTSVSSGVTWAVNTWYLLSASITSGSCVFTVNNASSATISTNIPVAGCGPIAKIMKSVGSTTRIVYLDSFQLAQNFSGNRY